MRFKIDDVATDECHAKTIGELYNNSYLDRDSIRGVYLAVIERCEDLGLDYGDMVAGFTDAIDEAMRSPR